MSNSQPIRLSNIVVAVKGHRGAAENRVDAALLFGDS
jgi:hypothetical protein